MQVSYFSDCCYIYHAMQLAAGFSEIGSISHMWITDLDNAQRGTL